MRMRTHSPVKTLAPNVVVEAPESVALLLYSASATRGTALFEVGTRALEAAAMAAAEALGKHFAVTGVTGHLVVAEDATFPRPHAHLEVRDRVDARLFEGWARYAHARYQAELQTRLYDGGVGITRDFPSPHGWEITAAIPQLGKVQRMRCGNGRDLYPLELEMAEQRAHRAVG